MEKAATKDTDSDSENERQDRPANDNLDEGTHMNNGESIKMELILQQGIREWILILT